MRIRHWALSLITCTLLIGLWGCADLQPQTAREGIAVGYTSIKSLADTTAVAYQHGYIDAAKCNSILDRIQSAQNLLVEAQRLDIANEQDKAMVALKVAQAILREIDVELQR